MKLPIKYLDLRKQFQDEALWNVLKKQFETCQFVMGSEVDAFEESFARLCGTNFAVGVNSGTDALFLALKALNIGSGDEVITVSNSFIATTGAIIAAGAKPVFVDVGPDYNMDPELMEQAVTPNTRAVLPVHLTGNPADMDRISEIARRRSLYIIEDAAQAVSASIRERTVGSFGDAGCFSLHPLKNLNVCGDGGILTTKSEEICSRIRFMRNHGLKNRDEIDHFGYNSRLDTIQAVIASYGLSKLHAVTEKRIENARRYDASLAELGDFVTLPPRRDGVHQVFHTYVIQAERRDDLAQYLSDRGIETKIHYPIPIHLQKPCRDMGYRKGDFPVCEKQAMRILSLPIHQHLAADQIDYVVQVIKEFYKNR
jgi:aminotransferase EvaB